MSAAGLALLTTSGEASRSAGLPVGEVAGHATGDARLDAAPPEFAPLRAAHHRPRPRLQAARALAAFNWVTAMMDLSDGLARRKTTSATSPPAAASALGPP